MAGTLFHGLSIFHNCFAWGPLSHGGVYARHHAGLGWHFSGPGLGTWEPKEAVSFAVSFSAQYTQGVQNVSFTIFDVDFGAFQDQLRSIIGLSIDGFTQIAATITTSSSNTVTGSGLSQVVNGIAGSNNLGAGSGDGNVTISFGNNAIRSFSLIYGSGSSAPADPGTQKIGFHDLTFTPVPEINPAWSAALSCFAAAGFVFHHHAKFRR